VLMSMLGIYGPQLLFEAGGMSRWRKIKRMFKRVVLDQIDAIVFIWQCVFLIRNVFDY